jgi:hypothetical protein
VYTGVSNEYRNRLLRRALDQRFGSVLNGDGEDAL